MDASLTVGAWTHADVLTRGGRRILREMLDWVDSELGGPASMVEREPVNYLVTGADEWRSASEWPPFADHRTLYLAPGGRLVDDLPPASAEAVGFIYDPGDPTPTLGGRLLARDPGYREDSALARRSDTLVFATEPLSQPLELIEVGVSRPAAISGSGSVRSPRTGVHRTSPRASSPRRRPAWTAERSSSSTRSLTGSRLGHAWGCSWVAARSRATRATSECLVPGTRAPP